MSTTYYLVKQCDVCGNQFDHREIDELEAMDKEPYAVMVNYDQYSDIKEIMVTGCCSDCEDED